MKKYEKIYRELSKKYSNEEIADSMLIPANLTEEEKSQANEELRAFRFKLLREQTEDQRIFSDLMKLSFQIEDYTKNDYYIEEKSFGKYLEEYIRTLKITKKRLSEDLGIHYTSLSRIINSRDAPNTELMYRLEKHSGNLIPAVLWWKLMIKKQEYLIKKDKKTRQIEAAKVKNGIKFRA